MPFLKKTHPWNGGYAIPKYVLSEPPGFGTHTTKYTPRGTISPMTARAPTFQSGYAVPKYIHEEPIGRGVFVTKQLPRKTISTTVPSMFATGNYEAVGADYPDWALENIVAFIKNERRRGMNDKSIVERLSEKDATTKHKLGYVGCTNGCPPDLIADAFAAIEGAKAAGGGFPIVPAVIAAGVLWWAMKRTR
jgi:hypothetical protein